MFDEDADSSLQRQSAHLNADIVYAIPLSTGLVHSRDQPAGMRWTSAGSDIICNILYTSGPVIHF